MDYILLGVDGIIFGLCIRDYLRHNSIAKALTNAPELPLDVKLQDYIERQPNKKVDYAIIRGTVTPTGTCIQSTMSPTVTGVIQVIQLSEHRFSRGFAGFWMKQNNLINKTTNEVPFTLCNGSTAVKIINGLSAEILDLDVVHDSYKPSNLSLFDHMFGFFSGIRQRGTQTTEEMLRDGSFITAVGKLESDGNSLRLLSSPVGPFLLSISTREALIKRYNDAKTNSLIYCNIFGGIAAIILGSIIRKIYTKRK